MNFALEISRVDYVALILLLGFHLFSHVGRGVSVMLAEGLMLETYNSESQVQE